MITFEVVSPAFTKTSVVATPIFLFVKGSQTSTV
jgi:hypothetical protein